MNYYLPQFPTTCLEALMHLDVLSRSMIKQHENLSTDHRYVAALIPLAHVAHIGSMTMMTLKLLSTSCNPHYTIIYDPSMSHTDGESINLDNQSKLTTRFGHQVLVQSDSTIIPSYIEEIISMVNIYHHITQLTILRYDQVDEINPQSTLIWLGGNLHTNNSLEDSLAQDEKILGMLAMGKIEDTQIVGYNIIATMSAYYHAREEIYDIIPTSYHNTALLDGQKSHTSGYCSTIITQE